MSRVSGTKLSLTCTRLKKKEGEEFDFPKNIVYVSVGHEARASVLLFQQYLMSRHHLIMSLLSNSLRNLKSSYSLCSGVTTNQDLGLNSSITVLVRVHSGFYISLKIDLAYYAIIIDIPKVSVTYNETKSTVHSLPRSRHVCPLSVMSHSNMLLNTGLKSYNKYLVFA